MRKKCWIALALGAVALASPALARAQSTAAPPAGVPQATLLPPTVPATTPPRATLGMPVVPGQTVKIIQQMPTVQETPAPAQPGASPDPMAGEGSPAETRPPTISEQEGRGESEQPLGPTPLLKVGILQNAIFGDNKDSRYQIAGWLDSDYTFRSTGPGQNNVAPVQNRFGDEFLMREIGLYFSRKLDPKTWSWGFNIIYIAGSDASFIQPTAGWPAQTNPRFGQSFTDLNLTAHLPILTEGGVDIKAGRQTTVLGPMGALAWQRPFTSSDYAWYNLEEGRYTGVSANWIISKQLSWYNGVEIGGWGVFFDDPVHGVDYLTQINYWLDEDAKKTKVWMTVLTGPTGHFMNGNTTTLELGMLHNWNKYVYTIIDTQNCWSKAGVFSQPDPFYRQRAYDVYQYTGFHLNCTLDLTTRLEWYKDVDGRNYPGGFGVPHTDYYEGTVGLNYHPTKWMEFRPEIRYDYATHPNFGQNNNLRNQLSIAADLLLKF